MRPIALVFETYRAECPACGARVRFDRMLGVGPARGQRWCVAFAHRARCGRWCVAGGIIGRKIGDMHRGSVCCGAGDDCDEPDLEGADVVVVEDPREEHDDCDRGRDAGR